MTVRLMGREIWY